MPHSSLIIFVEKRTARMQYIVQEMLWRRLGLEPQLTTDIEAFLASEDAKMVYADRQMEGQLQLYPAKILFEKRIQHQEVDMRQSDGLQLFTNARNPMGFDPFAAAFYLMTRYEEYLPHREDDHGRFTLDQHTLFADRAYQEPWVERYAWQLFEWLQTAYPALKASPPIHRSIVSVDIDQLFAMKAKGLVRTILSTARDTLRGKLPQRSAVMLGRVDDPNDVYDKISNACNKAGVRPLYFVQVGESSRFDINNPPHLYQVRQRINEIGLSAEVGVHPSYFSSIEESKFLMEVDRLRDIMAGPVTQSRQHYLRFTLPSTFHKLHEVGIQEDFSMGFHDANGFRAGTCVPFHFFDLVKDEVLPLTLYPLTWMDIVAERTHPREEDALNELITLHDRVKEVGGTMVTTWHPEVLVGSSSAYSTWNIFDRYLEHANV